MADYNFNGKDLSDVLGSYNSYKGKRTTAARKLELLLDLQSKSFSAITTTNINAELKNCERIVEILAALANWLLEQKYEKAKDFLEETEGWVDQVRTYADLSIKVHHNHAVASKPVQGGLQAVAPPQTGAVTKPDQELRPPKLRNDTTMGELRDWQDQFTSYYNSSNLRQMTYLQQQGYLLSTLDTEITRHLRREITATTPIFPSPGSLSCFDLLTNYFSQRNPIHLRRQAFFSATQKEGQSVLDFRANLRALGNEGDLESLTLEGCYCLVYLLGVKDDTLRRELCKVAVPTLAEFDNILEAHALVEASEKLRSKSAHANRAAGAQKKSSSAGSSRNNPARVKLTEDEKKRRGAIKGKCYRCGAGDHMIPGCTFPPSVVCKSCKAQGHIAAACIKTSSARATTDSTPDPNQLQLQYSPDSSAASSFYVPQPGHQRFNQPTPELPL